MKTLKVIFSVSVVMTAAFMIVNLAIGIHQGTGLSFWSSGFAAGILTSTVMNRLMAAKRTH